ncbi:MAG: cAMP-dependent protein kinase type regulatory subunit [Parachlamydiales bacterium]|nr:cAMP-dependent protein kinase type regulatory subunit [Parachlamydiales bacterium]
MKHFSLIEKAFFLKKVKIFNDLDLDLLLAIAEKLLYDEYDQKDQVFSLHQAANRMYIIYDGTVQILDERMRAVCELNSGDFFGDESLFNEQPRSYFAICKTDVRLFILSRSHLLSVISECPSVAVALLQSYANPLSCRLNGAAQRAP